MRQPVAHMVTDEPKRDEKVIRRFRRANIMSALAAKADMRLQKQMSAKHQKSTRPLASTAYDHVGMETWKAQADWAVSD